ncbi:hypothetical protein N7499_013064 [Penicillium canescens]|uniref:Luciferase domain-containing protein n=1 Tax=Penicillium canescens TaxID=5083 RepID=A0AAD6N4T5_PENCN|nr:uncharacterized protein N7446_000294 [Penicillium canescens]KAJ6011966.1 hypothetical protein N7522_002321 [Penicillium canescens]KAJ6030643.1 hypothetical protein N7460_010909 [Penicillium canescens]KAJ6059641.1 hypothetical protein N7444_003280 [Penicillium canescens]KAJ6064384.1 hypothetical protein N7499_013064 [Penicillium canescens]KAJ6077358.1 hypothetical protein N7446_000294 [Penicillium canescens]
MPIPTLQTLTSTLNTHSRVNVALSAFALLTSTLLLPAAYRDYKIFKSYGPGGVPNNALGWILVRVFFQPFGREMLSTDEYVRRIAAAEGHGKGDEGFLMLSERRKEGRPVVGPHVVPQRQLTQVPDEVVMEKFCDVFNAFGLRNHHLVKLSRSNLENHVPALFFADHIPSPGILNGEIAHIHSGNDHSAHVILAPADCIKVIEAGWGQRHAFSGSSAMTYLSLGTRPDIPAEYLLIYAPRTEAEIETVMQIIAAAVKFMTGREDVR